MSDELRRLLDELGSAIEAAQADGEIDATERSHLRDLVGRVEGVLAEPEGEHHGVGDQLEEAAIRFEGRHPTIAAAIRSAVDTLSGYGI